MRTVRSLKSSRLIKSKPYAKGSVGLEAGSSLAVFRWSKLPKSPPEFSMAQNRKAPR
jgi:hypothetical protein